MKKFVLFLLCAMTIAVFGSSEKPITSKVTKFREMTKYQKLDHYASSVFAQAKFITSKRSKMQNSGVQEESSLNNSGKESVKGFITDCMLLDDYGGIVFASVLEPDRFGIDYYQEAKIFKTFRYGGKDHKWFWTKDEPMQQYLKSENMKVSEEDADDIEEAHLDINQEIELCIGKLWSLFANYDVSFPYHSYVELIGHHAQLALLANAYRLAEEEYLKSLGKNSVEDIQAEASHAVYTAHPQKKRAALYYKIATGSSFFALGILLLGTLFKKIPYNRYTITVMVLTGLLFGCFYNKWSEFQSSEQQKGYDSSQEKKTSQPKEEEQLDANQLKKKKIRNQAAHAFESYKESMKTSFEEAKGHFESGISWQDICYRMATYGNSSTSVKPTEPPFMVPLWAFVCAFKGQDPTDFAACTGKKLRIDEYTADDLVKIWKETECYRLFFGKSFEQFAKYKKFGNLIKQDVLTARIGQAVGAPQHEIESKLRFSVGANHEEEQL